VYCVLCRARRNFTDCFNISLSLARLKYKLPDDGLGPKYVGAILSFNVNFRVF
jgi:hypothetical protein